MGRRTRGRLFAALACLTLAAGIPAGSAAQADDAPRLGAHYDSGGDNIDFAVYSAAATRMDVYVYSKADGAAENVSYQLNEGDDVFSATVSVADLAEHGVTGTVYYGYRAWGPNWTYDATWKPGSSAGFQSDVDADGNRFDPNKLLLDPYAREVSHDPLRPGMTDKTIYASGPKYRDIDSGPQAPKGIVLPDADGDTGTAPTGALAADVIYEVNVRGFTKSDPSVPADERGTFAGAATKAGYLADLGVSAVELLPVQDGPNDGNDIDPNGASGDNYWNYATLNYFSPDRRYAADRSPGGPTKEFQAMVKAFHARGIKVLMDVVYNHSGEGYAWDTSDKNTYNLESFRGLDNPTYYSLTADRQGSYDNTGVGGNLNTRNPATRDLIVDSLTYWRQSLGVDGFRHDLAPILGNTCQHGCFKYSKDDPDTALAAITKALPPRPAAGGDGTDWIAEPWALGDGTYQVGNFPSGWAEWNDKYRDTLRADQNKLGTTAVTPGQLATRFTGSSDLYGGRSPGASVNFMVAHDGFTLHDLYACDDKNNGQSWPYGPSDGGSDNNNSWDQGGDAAAQRQAARNGMAFLATSAGTPMMTGGDETLRGIRCNNNPYNVDSSANWLSWSPDPDQSTFDTYTSRLLAFRHAHPALRPTGFYTGKDEDEDGLDDLDWFTPRATTPDDAYFDDADNHALAWRLDGSELGDDAAGLYIGYNGWSGDVDFTLPDPGAGKQWYRVTDTASWAEGPDQVAKPGAEAAIGGQGTSYTVHGRSMVLMLAK